MDRFGKGVRRLRAAAVVLVKGRRAAAGQQASPTYEEFKARWLRERQRQTSTPWSARAGVQPPPETFEGR